MLRAHRPHAIACGESLRRRIDHARLPPDPEHRSLGAKALEHRADPFRRRGAGQRTAGQHASGKLHARAIAERDIRPAEQAAQPRMFL